MRAIVDQEKIKRLMQALGREAQGSGCIYFTGWRDRSVFIGKQGYLLNWKSLKDLNNLHNAT